MMDRNRAPEYTMDLTPVESAYAQGKKQAALQILRHLLKLIYPHSSDPVARAATWEVERTEVVSTLRDICAEHGDNEWADDRNLADVLAQHLLVHLADGEEITDRDAEDV